MGPGATIVGRYRLIERLGRGGMGEVWRAEHVVTGGAVALKLLHPHLRVHEERDARFLTEARAPAAIGHPGLVPVLDAGVTAEGDLFLVMELLAGETLASRLGAAPLPMDEIRRIGGAALDVLRAAHAAGFVHRDLKPENLFLLAPQGSLKILDFGIAKVLDDRAPEGTATGAVLGTLPYMSPEQLRSARSVDHRTDLWSLGVVIYQMATGALPYVAEGVGDLLLRVLSAPPPPLGEHLARFPPALAGFLHKALAVEPSARFASAAEMAAALAAIPDGPLCPRGAPEGTEQGARPRRWSPSPGVLGRRGRLGPHFFRAAAVLLFALSALAVFYGRPDPAAASRRLLADAAARVGGKTYYPGCLTLEEPPAAGFSAARATLFNALSQVNGPRRCAGGPRPQDLLGARRPFLLLGEPGAGKHFELLKMQKQATDEGIPSVFLKVHDCPRGAGGAIDLRSCVRRAVEDLLTPLPLHRRAAAAFLERRDWWLFLDGLDDDHHHDPEILGPLLAELSQLERWHGGLIAGAGSGEGLAYAAAVYMNNTDVMDVLTRFRRVFMHGLDDDGAQRMMEDKRAGGAPAFQACLTAGQRLLRAMTSCPGPLDELAAAALRRPGYLRDIADACAAGDTAWLRAAEPCADARARYQWLMTMRFRAYCNGPGCKSAVLRPAFYAALQAVCAEGQDVVDADTVRRLGGEVPSFDEVLHSLLYSGVLTVKTATLFGVLPRCPR